MHGRREHSAPASPGSGGEAAVLLTDARVVYGTRVALEGLTLRVDSGEIVGLLGPNGAGKSTTMDVCCGLRGLTGGSARVRGHDCAHPDREMRRRLGLVPQESGLYLDLTPRENLRLFARLYDVPRAKSRIEELLELFALSARGRDRVSSLSGGMRRRLALARALLHDPPVLLLDEPTLGVDVHGRRVLWDHIAALREDGRAILVATNYLDEAAELCDRVAILDEGRLVADASPAELRRVGTTLVLETDDPASVTRELVARHGLAVEADGSTVRIRLDGQDDLGPLLVAVSAHGAVHAVRMEEPTLEDVFLGLTGRGPRE